MGRRRKTRLVPTIFVVVALALFLPGNSIAGSLEPSDPPGPTMKTLDQIPPTWSQKLQCDATACPRFETVMDGEAVLDKETGLVWERSPSGSYTSGYVDWFTANYICTAQKYYSGRRGWRLPTVQEFASLIDMTVPPSPTIPIGHPFSNVLNVAYWSATTYANDTSRAWEVYMNNGGVGYKVKTSVGYVWCVRGGQGVDPQ